MKSKNANANAILLYLEKEVVGVFTSITALLESECSPICGKITRDGLQKVRNKQGGFPFTYGGFVIDRKPLINQKTVNMTDVAIEDSEFSPKKFEE